MQIRSKVWIYLSVTAFLAVRTSTNAALSDQLNVHGSLSASASYSDTTPFLGDTRNQAKLNVVDLILNSSHRFDNGLRAGAQVYAFKLGSFHEVTLDFANADYAFSPYFGIRAGRNKLPFGLYNDAQDLDAIRTFASLPFSFYPRSMRAIDASFDGVSLYGSVPVGRAGSFDYQVYGGALEQITGLDTPLLRAFSIHSVKFDKWTFGGGVYGGSVFWNLPIEGLKVGYSIELAPNADLYGSLGTSASIPASERTLATMVDAALGKGTWDYSGRFAGTPALISDVDMLFRAVSIEYSIGKWVFAVESKVYDQLHGTAHIPAFGLVGQPSTFSYTNYGRASYGMVSYQATARVGLGYYYSDNTDHRKSNTAQKPVEYSHDHAAVVSYNVNRWCVTKLEYHNLEGFSVASFNGDTVPPDVGFKRWNYVILKTTISF